MKYKLLSSGNGILIDRMPVLGDIKDTYTVSFLLSDNGAYIALFAGADSVEYRKAIIEGACKLPKELLSKDQYVDVKVCKIDGDKVLQVYNCEQLKVTAFVRMRKTQWELSGGMTEDSAINRLTELEQAHAKVLDGFAALKADCAQRDIEAAETLNVFRSDLDAHLAAIEILKRQNKALAESYNGAKDIINDLSRRLNALEKNYDPTIID